MAFFGSAKWYQLLMDSLNNDGEFEKTAAKYEGTMTIVVDFNGLDKPICVWCDPYHGKIREWLFLNDPAEKQSDFTLTADYDVWKAVCKGQQEVIKGIMGGKIKIKGNMMKLLKQTKPAIAFVNTMQNLPTEFPDEAFLKEA